MALAGAHWAALMVDNEPGSGTQTSTDDDSMDTSEQSSSGFDEDGIPLLKAPCTNIVDQLSTAFTSSELDFQGSIAFRQSYDDAPNPTLYLDGLGTVGLPLSDREARAVIENCIQAPFGMGERTVIDKEVRDTWEMDASKVNFESPAWKTFMIRVVHDVCRALGVNFNASQPRCELYKLLLYETGSHFLPHVDTEKADGMFASIIVVLPTRFTGGDAHLSHGNVRTIFDSSKDSLTKTTVLAWYTDVMHEIKPITSGYRFALAYNLVHTTTSLRPSLSDSSNSFRLIRHILLSWKQQKSEPQKIVYVLHHKYSRANMSSSALKGKDAHLLSIVDTIAKELGLYLGLANIEHNEKGYAEDHGYGEHDGDVTMAEVEETSTTVAHLVNLEGQLISEELDVEEEAETIPAVLREAFDDDDWDDQDYEGYMGNGAGSLERFYRRSALVIWPKWTRIGRDHGDRRSQYALETLRCLQGPEPTEKEGALFDYLCCSAKYLSPSITVPKLFPAARQWRSVERWCKLSKSFVGSRLLAALPFEEVIQAISLFGFEGIKSGLKAMVLHDPTNQDRFQFLVKLQGLTDEQGYNTLSHDISTFVSDVKSDCLDQIGVPTVEDVLLLTHEALSSGGARRLKDGILPQLKNLASADVLEAFASHLQSVLGTQRLKHEEESILREMIRDMLAALLDKLDLFKLYVAPTPRYSWRAPEPDGKPDIAMKFIKQCLDSANVHVAADALERMITVCGQPDEVSRMRTKKVLLPLVPLLSQDLKSRSPRPNLPLSKLSETSVKKSLEILDLKGGTFGREDFSPIVDATIIGDDATLLMSSVLPKVKSYPWNEASWKAVLEELHAHRNDLILPEDSPYSVSTVIAEMAQEYARKAVLTSTNTYYKTTSIPDTLQFSLMTGGPDCLAIVLNRLLASTLTSQYVSGTLVPLIPELKRLSNANGIPLHSEPFASALRKIMKGWVEKVMGPKPNDAAAQPLLAKLSRWTCGDTYCRQVRQFLTSKPDRVLSLDRIGAPSQKHVERCISNSAWGTATSEMISTVPRGLKITKADALFKPVQWRANQQKGYSLLRSIGDDDLLKRVWEDQLPALLSMLAGERVSSQPGASLIGQVRTAQVSGAATSSQPGASNSAPVVTPAKRKIMEVIDLTTP